MIDNLTRSLTEGAEAVGPAWAVPAVSEALARHAKLDPLIEALGRAVTRKSARDRDLSVVWP